MSDFTGSRVLILGGSSGIGLEAARAFSAAGAEVTLASRSEQKLEAARQALQEQVLCHPLDITDDEALARFFAAGTLWDHVVITAAETPMGAVRELPLEQAHAAMESKFWGAYRVARLATIRPGGSLTFTAGYLSVRPGKKSGLQSAINAALEALARGLALELAPVRVNTVSPGLVATSLWDGLDETAREQMYQAAAARLPVGRVGQPQDIARGILFLAANPYTTGTTLFIDGGGTIAG